MYLVIGIPWIMRSVKWQKYSNESVRKELNKLIKTRGSIAQKPEKEKPAPMMPPGGGGYGDMY
jgi:hypothetical protein